MNKNKIYLAAALGLIVLGLIILLILMITNPLSAFGSIVMSLFIILPLLGLFIIFYLILSVVKKEK